MNMSLKLLHHKKCQFQALNPEIEPTHIALSIQEFYQLKASMYIPGVHGMTLREFKSGRIMVLGLQLVWKDAVVC